MIYTTREININGSTATIDEDIYLFKQDSNIELKFIINDTRFTFQTVESSNVVESSNASYFRVKLLNPYGKTINFPIQEVTDNYIVLLIKGELIDEDTEVGDYTIQIRLYDKDKNSKLTLPAIANCIHIQQPIFSEVEESTVDTAAIDTASVMMSDEGELPVVDSTGKYIPTLWDTGDTISKAKINHIEKGILQAHTDALGAKLQIITAPEGLSKPDIITLFNELPESGFVYIRGDYILTPVSGLGSIRIHDLCCISSYTSDEGQQLKIINCYSEGIIATLNSSGDVIYSRFNNLDFNTLMSALESSDRKKGKVLTMLDADKYGWADTTTIPKITPPEGQTTSDIINIYNELPDNGLVFFTKAYGFADAFIVGLCSVGAYTTENGNPAKTIICTSNAMSVDITSTGVILDYGISNFDLDNLMKILNNKRRTKGQVLTMISNSEYGWGDVIPQVTPPKGTEKSDLVTLYNMLPDKGLVYITGSYPITDDVMVGYLCEVATSTTQVDDLSDESTGDTSQNSKSVKTIVCYATGMAVDITSTGVVEGFGMCIPEFNDLMGALTSQAKKKGQVLTMIDNNTFDWADTTPKLCIHEITGNAEVELTLDPYQLINISDATPQDLSPKYTVDILTPNIEESDNHVYKIHVIFMADSKTVYIMPSGMYDHPPTELTDGMIYEFIFTYVKPKWLVHCIEYSNKVSSEPQ